MVKLFDIFSPKKAPNANHFSKYLAVFGRLPGSNSQPKKYCNRLLVLVFGHLFWQLGQNYDAHFLAFHFGGEQNAGFLIAALALIQMLFLQPLAGRIFDQKGLIFAFKIGLAFEILAGLIFFIFQSKWAMLFFLFGYLARASFFIMEPFLLRNINPKKSGFFFGLSQEVVAAAHFLGLLAFPFFLKSGNEIFLPLFSVFFAAVSFFFLREVAEKKPFGSPISSGFRSTFCEFAVPDSTSFVKITSTPNSALARRFFTDFFMVRSGFYCRCILRI